MKIKDLKSGKFYRFDKCTQLYQYVSGDKSLRVDLIKQPGYLKGVCLVTVGEGHPWITPRATVYILSEEEALEFKSRQL